MKSVKCLIVFCGMLLFAFYVNASYIYLGGNPSNPNDVTLPVRYVETVADGVIVTYLFPSVELIDDPIFTGSKNIRISGFGQNDISGKPEVLNRKDYFIIPEGNTYRVDVLNVEYEDYNIKLGPSRLPLVESSDTAYSVDNVEPIEPYTGFYPQNNIEVKSTYEYCGNLLVGISVSPIQYRYMGQKTRITRGITYKVTFINNSSNTNSTNDRKRPKFIKNLVLNNDSINSEDIQENQQRIVQGVEPNNKYTILDTHYLIITDTTYLDEVERFAHWKNLLGYKTHVVSKQNWQIQEVKDSINSYCQDYNIENLLIVGDYEDVPSVEHEFKGKFFVSDFDYGDINDDNFPDIHRGRISVSSVQEAKDIFDKIISYEQNPPTIDAFYNSAAHCAFFQDMLPRDGYEDRRFVLTSEEIRDSLMSREHKVIDRFYKLSLSSTPMYYNNTIFANGAPLPIELLKPNFSWTFSINDFFNSINNGRFYMLYRGHGNVKEWESIFVSTNSFYRFNNSNLTPVVFSITCKTGKFNHPEYPCFAESLLRIPNGGAIGVVAASETSYSGLNDAFTYGIFDALWPNCNLIPQFGNITLNTPTRRYVPLNKMGEVLDLALMRVSETYDMHDSEAVLATKRLFHFFGDPTMQLYTEKPTNFENINIERSDSTIMVRVYHPLTMIEDATIVFYNVETDSIDTFEGKKITYKCDDPSLVQVCVSGRNKIPFIENSPNLCFNPNSNYIYNPSWQENCLRITSRHPIDYTSTSMIITNDNTQQQYVTNVCVEDSLSGFIVFDENLANILSINDYDVFSASVVNLKNIKGQYLPNEHIDAKFEFRSDSAMPKYETYCTNDRSIVFCIDSIQICEQIELFGPVYAERQKNIQYLVTDSIGHTNITVSLESADPSWPNIFVRLSRIKDDRNFYYPYGYFIARYVDPYDSGAELIDIYPSPEETTYEELVEVGSVSFRFSDFVKFRGTTNLLHFYYEDSENNRFATIGYNIDDINVYYDGDYFETNDYVVEVPIPEVPTIIQQNNIDWTKIKIRFMQLCSGQRWFIRQPECDYSRELIDNNWQESDRIRKYKQYNIENNDDPEIIYDLTGREMHLNRKQLAPGFYILNNKKILVK